ncbi:hypothetical protein SLEP1_g40731 [Rubroshorea leprosula]|uniref:Uncharacterized protein n=1 Tax=Rubroshorea leprosula TaxID=152421 RepID=A0AAV5L4S7_9ROSI|nr:hypothetical protein SLEP1_g40731 [Rubroshorea leprosula]
MARLLDGTMNLGTSVPDAKTSHCAYTQILNERAEAVLRFKPPNSAASLF